MKDTIHKNFLDVGQAVDLCLEKDLITPALILIYSSIDAAAWLWSDPTEKSTRRNFEAWVNEFMLPGEGLNCTATDLYGARCGLVHTLTSESRLADAGAARQIAYACREADGEELKQRAAGRFVVIHVEHLLRGFVEGAVKFIESLGPSNPKTGLAFRRARSYFARVDEDDVGWAVMPHPEGDAEG